MGDELMKELDKLLAEELPDTPEEFDEDSEPGRLVGHDRREELIQLLQYAADELGKSPSFNEFNELDLHTSADVIKYVFGSWNAAKEAAGLKRLTRGGPRTGINETYFKQISTPEKAYWLGTLFAHSSVRRSPGGGGLVLSVGRTGKKGYFVTEFADAIESEYAISENAHHETGNTIFSTLISNPTFVGHLFDAGYPYPDSDAGGFPAIPDGLEPHFLRGWLESSGYFTTNGFNISVSNVTRAETIQQWMSDAGAKRPTLTEKQDGRSVVRVSNLFDVRAVFESLWPDLTETAPSFPPYPRKILDFLNAEHPYPENVPYLSA